MPAHSTKQMDSSIRDYFHHLRNAIEEYNLSSIREMLNNFVQISVETFEVNFNRSYESGSCEEKIDEKTLSVGELLKEIHERRGTILLGEAGIGKTVLIENMIMEMTSVEPTECSLIPILIRMRSYDCNRTPEENIKENLSAQMAHNYGYLKEKMLVFLDALDETPTQKKDAVKELYEYITNNKMRWVASCRHGAYHRNENLRMGSRGIAHKIKLWDLPEICEYIEKLSKKDSSPVLSYICGKDSRIIKNIWTKFKKINEIDRFWDVRSLDRQQSIDEPQYLDTSELIIWKNVLKNGLLTISRNPYMLRLIYEVYHKGTVKATQLNGLSIILKNATDMMIERESSSRFGKEIIENFICTISMEMKNNGRDEVSVDDVFKSSELCEDDCKQLMRISCGSRIVAVYKDVVRFSHKKLQEYFDSVVAYKQICLGNRIHSSKNLHMIIEWGGDLTTIISNEHIDLDEFVESLQKYDKITEPLKQRVEEYCNTLLKNAKTAEDVIKYTKILGRLNITFNGAGCIYDLKKCRFLPDVDWCTLVIENNNSKKTIKVSKYPITVSQYESFVTDGGYTFGKKKYWSEEAWNWKKNRLEPANWSSPRIACNPVVNITWYEASAFCSWLSEMICEDSKKIRLPTEEEWDAIAKMASLEGLQQSYDPQWHFLNTSEKNIGGCVPVGMSKGLSENCPCDIYGNVWEWCNEEWQKGATVSDLKVIKGGSWRNSLKSISDSDRNCHAKLNSSNCVGFRVVEVEHENTN